MVPNEEPIGEVVDYDPDLGAARVHLEEGDLRVGDRIHISGQGTDVEDRVETLQLPEGPADEAHAGDDVGLPVPEAVETGAKVLRVASSGGGPEEDPYDRADAGLLDSVFDA
jgi:putative protease